jgi:hypothetical protein
MICGVIPQCAIRSLPATELLPVIERTVFRLTADNAALAVPRRAVRRPSRAKRRRSRAR